MKRIALLPALLALVLMLGGCVMEDERIYYVQAEALYKQVVTNEGNKPDTIVWVKSATVYPEAKRIVLTYSKGDFEWRTYEATLYREDMTEIVRLITSYNFTGQLRKGYSQPAAGVVDLVVHYPVLIESPNIFAIKGSLFLETIQYLPIDIYNPNDAPITVTVDGVDHVIVAESTLHATE
jgi:hypothetical protein